MMDNRKNFNQITIILSVLFIFMIYIYYVFYPFVYAWEVFDAEAWVLLIFGWIDSVPFFAALIFIYKSALEMKKNNLYSEKVIKYNYLSCLFLLICILFLMISNIVFYINNYSNMKYIDIFIMFVCASIISILLFVSCIIKASLTTGKKLKKIIILFRISILFLAILIIFIISFFNPYTLQHLLIDKYLINIMNLSNEVLFYTPVIFYYITGIPVLVVLVLAWMISIHIAKNNSFSKSILKLVKIIIIILSIDFFVFIIGNAFFYNSNWFSTSLFNLQCSIVYAALICSLMTIFSIIKKKVLLSQITSINN